MKAFKYCGPVTHVELIDDTVMRTARPVALQPGRIYQDLPETHPVIVNLIARQLLIAEPDSPPIPPVELAPPVTGQSKSDKSPANTK